MSLLFIFASVLLFGISWWVQRRYRYIKTHWQTVTGQVVGLEKRELRSSNGLRITWWPRIEYEVDGYRYQFLHAGSSSNNPWREGQTVEVLYEPGNPLKADLLWGHKAMSLIFATVALILAIVGAVTWKSPVFSGVRYLETAFIVIAVMLFLFVKSPMPLPRRFRVRSIAEQVASERNNAQLVSE